MTYGDSELPSPSIRQRFLEASAGSEHAASIDERTRASIVRA